jgi:predicted transcriptional regulator
MLTVETIGRIRREHFLKGKTIRRIARDLRLSRNTVRKVLRSGETSFAYEREVQPRPKLGRWTAELEALLAGNVAKPVRERLTVIRIFEDLRERVIRAATTQCGAMPSGGARRTGNRWPLPMCR